MRKVNPTEHILSPEQWKHMRVSFYNFRFYFEKARLFNEEKSIAQQA